jgi:hypothetical protein
MYDESDDRVLCRTPEYTILSPLQRFKQDIYNYQVRVGSWGRPCHSLLIHHRRGYTLKVSQPGSHNHPTRYARRALRKTNSLFPTCLVLRSRGRSKPGSTFNRRNPRWKAGKKRSDCPFDGGILTGDMRGYGLDQSVGETRSRLPDSGMQTTPCGMVLKIFPAAEDVPGFYIEMKSSEIYVAANRLLPTIEKGVDHRDPQRRKNQLRREAADEY